MRLTCERDTALASLSRVQAAVKRGAAIPVLAGVLIAADESAHVAATDRDAWAGSGLAAEIEATGSIVAPLDPLLDVLRSFPAGADFLFSLDGTRIALACGRAKVSLPAIPASDFPTAPDDNFELAGALPSQTLRGLVERTRYAASRDATRYALQGVHLLTRKDGKARALRAVATDGWNLALADAEIGKGVDLAATIATRSCDMLLRLLPETTEPVEISTREGLVRFALAGGSLVTKTVDYDFPDYERSIPQERGRVVTFDREPMQRALKRVLVVAGDQARTFSMGVDEGVIQFAVRNFDSGEALDEIEAASEGPRLDLRLSAPGLLATLEECGGETIEMAVLSERSPLMIRRLGQDHTLSLVMPRAA